ncbi:MAG TPA: hypothetical protein VGP06_13085 [Janthinobacterium sp.]|jgi:hypothetical protein|nr:hypothetical protein [Janthinobacterium sp.]
MENQEKALASAAAVEQLADALSGAADDLHARVMDAIKKRQAAGLPPPAPAGAFITLEQAQTLFDREVALRQRANSLYTDAAWHAIAGLEASQRSVIALTDAAREKIRRMDIFKDWLGLSADLLALAGAVVAVDPGATADALKALRGHAGELKEDQNRPA